MSSLMLEFTPSGKEKVAIIIKKWSNAESMELDFNEVCENLLDSLDVLSPNFNTTIWDGIHFKIGEDIQFKKVGGGYNL